MDPQMRDCSTCIHHRQASPMNAFCFTCLMDPTLPDWELGNPQTPRERHDNNLRGLLRESGVDADSYMASIEERHSVAGKGEALFFPASKDDSIARILHASVPQSQSRKESLTEATLNTLSGFIVSFGMWLFVVAPLFGIQSNPVESFWITSLFTVVSVARSYVWRRLFVNKFWRKS